MEVAGGYQLRTAKVNADWVKKFLGGRPARMGRATLETLAIVAYRQPITRAQVEDIRGVDSGSSLRVLLERNLIRIVGKKEEPGRPMLYGTTSKFLEHFGFRSLDDLLRNGVKVGLADAKATAVGKIVKQALGDRWPAIEAAAVVTASAVVGLDQLTKQIAVHTVDRGDSVDEGEVELTVIQAVCERPAK